MNSKKEYVLEVVQFITEKYGENGWIQLGGAELHIGYMNSWFKTKDDAVSYYDRYNPHMRSLNAYNTYKSDWDPTTKLLYIVREDHDLIGNIDPFNNKDLPEIIKNTDSLSINYTSLK